MDVINKFCSTVSSTVSQLSGVLPGNPVTREYEATSHIASAGPGLLWKIYSGYKKSTKQPASIFVFEKRQVVPQDREVLLETLKRGVAQLTKLRHPQILVVQHPLEESRDCIAFATEPVFASLANALGKRENMPVNNDSITNFKLYDVEIKYGLLQVGEGLSFLHRDAKMLHHNICPSSIVINTQGAWKIFGFDFAVQNSSTDATPAWKYVDHRRFGHELAQPDLDYLAPECGLTESQSAASDIFSLGVLIFSTYNNGQPPYSNHDWSSYTTNMSKLKSLQASRLSSIPDGLKNHVKMMLNNTPELRPDEHEFIKSEFFEDVGVKALNYLDSLFQWDNKQKAHFYKGLPQILDKLPHRVCLYRVIPCLVKEFVNPMMVPFVLPNVFAITENCTKEDYTSHILPHLKTVMVLQEPIQILLLLMQRMELLLKMTPCDEVKSDVLPLLYRALESDSQEIQELCLSVLPTFANLVEYPAMKNALLPRIKRLCISTSHISVRVNCLLCLGKLLDFLDKWLVLDEVLPFLPQIPSREPAVLMGILGIYKLVLNHKKMNMSKEMMAQKVIPFLMPLSVENSLTLNQFNTLISVVKEMVTRVETEHRDKLEQLNDQTKALENSMPNLTLSTQNSNSIPTTEDLFNFNPTPKTTNSIAKIPTDTFTSLSLKDKERIIKQSESEKRLSSMPKLDPKPVPPKAPQPVKDLTATLFSSPSFDIGISRLPPTQNGAGSRQLGQTQFPSAGQLGQQQTSLPTFNQAAKLGQQQPSLMPLNQTPQLTYYPQGGTVMGLGSNTNARSPMVLTGAQNGVGMPNWSTGWSSPLLPNQLSQPTPPKAKSLSAAEINDLLS